MPTSKRPFDEFVRDRYEALRSLDLVKIRAYMAKYKIPVAVSDETLLCAVHKARLALYGLTRHERKVSRDWLLDRGYRLTM